MASLVRPLHNSSSRTVVPLFLAPALARAVAVSVPSTAQFSTSTPRFRSSAVRKQAGLKAKTEGKPNWSLVHRPKIDRNKQRGVSAIRRTGPRSTRGLWKHPLPVPVARDHKTTDPSYLDSNEHGLWGFFDKSRQAVLEPDEVCSHGRSWNYHELSQKSFEDLHKLYWVCVKEMNRSLTQEKERKRLRAGYGNKEAEDRVGVVGQTMEIIRSVLVDRQLSFNQANALIHEKYIADLLAGSNPDVLEEAEDPVQDDLIQPVAPAA